MADWVVCIEDKAVGVRIVDAEHEEICADDPAYGDIHIVPVNQEGEWLFFGCHEFNRKCYCLPQVKIEPDQRPVVVHQERKPN